MWMVAANFRRTHSASVSVRTESNDAVHTIDTGTRIVHSVNGVVA